MKLEGNIMNKIINEQLNKITTREDLYDFLKILIDDPRTKNGKWFNSELESYLEGISGFVNDLEGYYKNRNEEYPKDINYKLIAEILLSGLYYE